MRKPVFGVSDQAAHKPGYTTTYTRWLEALNFVYTRGLNVKHLYNGVVQVQDDFRYGFVEIDM